MFRLTPTAARRSCSGWTDRLGDLANLLEAITEAELSRSSNSYFAAGLDFVSKEINAVYAQIYDLVNGWEVTK